MTEAQIRDALKTLREAAAEKMAQAAADRDEAEMDDAQIARTALSNLERVFGSG